MHTQTDPTARLHPEAGELLNLIQHPDLLETQTLSQIRKILKDSGYEEADDPGEVTIGWGRKVGSPHAATNAIVATSDGTISSLHIGGKGQYSLNTYVEDLEHPDRTALYHIAAHEKTFPGNQGKKFHAWWERVKNEHRIPEIDLSSPESSVVPVQQRQSHWRVSDLFKNPFRRRG